MPRNSSTGVVVDVAFCRTKCGKLAVIHQDYYFHHNRKYKGGDYWCCAQRGCKVRLISNRIEPDSGRMEFARRNHEIQHHHPPNAPNLIEKEFRRQLINQLERITSSMAECSRAGSSLATSSSSTVRLVYDQIRARAVRRGVPQELIPSFWNVRSTMYRLRRRRSPHGGVRGTLGNPSAIEPPSESQSQEFKVMDHYDSLPQSEPMSLVTSERSPRPSSTSILYQHLSSSPSISTTPPTSATSPKSSTAPSPTYEATDHDSHWPLYRPRVTPVPLFFPFSNAAYGEQPLVLQQCVALHALYLRSLADLGYVFMQ